MSLRLGIMCVAVSRLISGKVEGLEPAVVQTMESFGKVLAGVASLLCDVRVSALEWILKEFRNEHNCIRMNHNPIVKYIVKV